MSGPRAERQKPTTRRHQWPRCAAQTRTGGACLAAGSGFGSRCLNHGGLSLGSKGAHVVLFGAESFGADLYSMGRRRRPEWVVEAVPDWVAAQLRDEDLLERGLCEQALRRTVLARCNRKPVSGRRILSRWPQAIGYRIARKLLERQRVAYGVFLHSKDLRRWTLGKLKPEQLWVRLTCDEMLAAICASGTRSQPQGPNNGSEP